MPRALRVDLGPNSGLGLLSQGVGSGDGWRLVHAVGRRRLDSWRWACMIVQTTSASNSGGQTHPSVVNAAACGARTMSPVAVMAIAASGTAAQRCGRSVLRTHNTAKSAQPTANPSRIAPVIT